MLNLLMKQRSECGLPMDHNGPCNTRNLSLTARGPEGWCVVDLYPAVKAVAQSGAWDVLVS